MPEYIKFEKPRHGVFVDSSFITSLMPSANGAYVKVYLFALMTAENGASCTHGDIARALHMLESDVALALEYWHEVGAIKTENGVVSFNTSRGRENVAPPYPDAPAHDCAPSPSESIQKRGSMEEVTGAVSTSKELSDMCMMAQEMLGKPLTSQDMSTLYWFYDALGFSPALILMLLEYCVSKDKRNMKYIERVAVSWHENGVKTLEMAEAHVKKESEKGGYFSTIRKLMRINDRSFSRSEEEYLTKWHDEYGMGEDMVALAYEYCIIQTSKLSFPYMDKILMRWNTENIHTVAQAEYDNEEFKRTSSQTKQPAPSRQPELLRTRENQDELERIMWEKLNKKGE